MYGLLWAGENGIESREQADSPYALVAVFFQSWQCCWRNGMNGQQVEGQHQFDSTVPYHQYPIHPPYSIVLVRFGTNMPIYRDPNGQAPLIDL